MGVEFSYSWKLNKTYLKHIRLEDIKIPEASTMIKFKEAWVGYGEQRWCPYEINASALKVIDFFLRNMIYDGWHTHSGYYIKYNRTSWAPFNFVGISGMDMHFMKNSDAKGEYITIVVVGLEEEEYSQFTIVYSYLI